MFKFLRFLLIGNTPNYFDWRKTSTSFEDTPAHTYQAMNPITLLGRGKPERRSFSPSVVSMLGEEPQSAATRATVSDLLSTGKPIGGQRR
jgi:hypothetical protein